MAAPAHHASCNVGRYVDEVSHGQAGIAVALWVRTTAETMHQYTCSASTHAIAHANCYGGKACEHA